MHHKICLKKSQSCIGCCGNHSNLYTADEEAFHLSYRYLPVTRESVQIRSSLIYVLHLFYLFTKSSMASGLSQMLVSVFYTRHFQIFRTMKFTLWIFKFLLLIVSSVKYQSFRYFLCEERVLTDFLFAVLVANFEFARLKKIHNLQQFPWNWAIWQNPDQERTNQNAQIYLKTISCHLTKPWSIPY